MFINALVNRNGKYSQELHLAGCIWNSFDGNKIFRKICLHLTELKN
jgi:hypothetical protein